MPDSPKKLCRNLRRQGFDIQRTHAGHFKLTHPSMIGFIIIGSALGGRAALNVRADIRRHMRASASVSASATAN